MACAASAGAHVALAPQHIRDVPGLGVAFLVAAAALIAAAVGLALFPDSDRAHHGAALLLVALVGAYALSVTTGLPLLVDKPEALDPVALATKAVEALGVVFALRLTPTTGGRGSLTRKEARQ